MNFETLSVFVDPGSTEFAVTFVHLVKIEVESGINEGTTFKIYLKECRED